MYYASNLEGTLIAVLRHQWDINTWYEFSCTWWGSFCSEYSSEIQKRISEWSKLSQGEACILRFSKLTVRTNQNTGERARKSMPEIGGVFVFYFLEVTWALGRMCVYFIKVIVQTSWNYLLRWNWWQSYGREIAHCIRRICWVLISGCLLRCPRSL